MSHDDDINNLSSNRPFEQVLEQYLTRRSVLKGGLATAAISMSGFGSAALAGKDHDDGWFEADDQGRNRHGRLLDFEPVPLAEGNGPVPAISLDYRYQVLIPWGEPLAPNADGHIIRWRDSERHTGLGFNWDIFLIAQDTHGTEGSYSDPDGRLFIQTDGGQKDGLNNQLLVADTLTGELRRLFTGVSGDEITGITLTPDRRTLFINTQHPGNGDPSVTNFPAELDGVTVPRDCTFVITRKNGGIIGS